MQWIDVGLANLAKLRSLNQPVAKILAVHTGGKEAKDADSDIAKGLKAQLLLARGARIMLTVNLPTVVFIKFDNYKGPTITTLDGIEVVPIVPIRRTWAKTE